MDDVDYLVEDNAMDDLEMDGTHGRTTFEDDHGQQLLRRQPMENWLNGGASWGQNGNQNIAGFQYLANIAFDSK